MLLSAVKYRFITLSPRNSILFWVKGVSTTTTTLRSANRGISPTGRVYFNDIIIIREDPVHPSIPPAAPVVTKRKMLIFHQTHADWWRRDHKSYNEVGGCNICILLLLNRRGLLEHFLAYTPLILPLIAKAANDPCMTWQLRITIIYAIKDNYLVYHPGRVSSG